MIWDVFTFHNETRILEIRRAELAGLRIAHVPVESRVTFSGQHRDIVLEDSYVASSPMRDVSEVYRENHQRRECRVAIIERGAAPGDTVIFGDVDEIPSIDAVRRSMDSPGPKTLKMPYHSLLATWRLPLDRDVWNHQWPVIGTLDEFDAIGEFPVVRAHSKDYPSIENAGWHLSSMGGPEVTLSKVASFVHHDDWWADGLDAEHLRDLAIAGRDIADRFDMERVPFHELPRALREHPERYREFLEVCW